MGQFNPLEAVLKKKKPPLPSILKDIQNVIFKKHASASCASTIQKFFPYSNNLGILKLVKGSTATKKIRVGVVFSGGQAPGGHNVLLGLCRALKKINPDSELLGFLNGPSGLLKQSYIPLTEDVVSDYQNLGGFDCIGSGRTKIETQEQLNQALKAVQDLNLDGFVIIGGDDSNTNAAVLAEFFKAHNQATTVVGVPKTIDGDLKNDYVQVSFGFDTASKVYSELIGNILIDARSAKKYYHFIKLMGRSASHITLECALKTNPNLIFIGEEVKRDKKSLQELIDSCVDLILQRAQDNKNYGVILIPEGLIDFIPEIAELNLEINEKIAANPQLNHENLSEHLSEDLKNTFLSLPDSIKKQLLLERDPHGNIQLAKIETEKLFISMITQKLKEHPEYHEKFSPISHYLGYEGRCAHPSPFDAEYTYTLGHIAALLVQHEFSGYMASALGLENDVEAWQLFGLPITSLLHLEKRHGKDKPVIQKALVDLKGKPYQEYLKLKRNWETDDLYNSPGPIQFFGDTAVTHIQNSLVKMN
ncbi:MAG: Pyrophosphate--fructose 6-phosphate 1-phosphotransferase [Chlamydiae bacterium]|nr:Pyrophosphate--fructose 6-phosphate 1-phosphotransferase [Chlamydiota bacterium]